MQSDRVGLELAWGLFGMIVDDPAAGPRRPQDFIRSVHRAPRLAEALTSDLCFFCIPIPLPSTVSGS